LTRVSFLVSAKILCSSSIPNDAGQHQLSQITLLMFYVSVEVRMFENYTSKTSRFLNWKC